MKKYILLVFTFINCIALACDKSASTRTTITGTGPWTINFSVCFNGSDAGNGDAHGFYIKLTGGTITSVSPTSITNSTTVSSSISGNTATWGPWNNNAAPCFVCTDDARVCYPVGVTTSTYPSSWEIGGQEFVPASFPFAASSCTSTGTLPPLPVKLLNFNLNYLEANKVNLTWETATEQNNSHFTLYKGTDIYNLNEIAKIQGSGNSTFTMSYSYVDVNNESYKGENYFYKLTQTDYDGKVETLGYLTYLPEKLYKGIQIELNTPFVSDKIQIKINTNYETELIASIYNVFGSLIKKEKITVKKGNSEVFLQMNEQALSSGLYFLAIENKGQIIESYKLINP